MLGEPGYQAGADEAYGALWSQAVQSIQELHGELERRMAGLEGRYVDFERQYAELTRVLEALGSVYAGCTSIEGRDSLMKLAAVLRTYRRRYTRESIDFNLINRLMTKLADLRERSLTDFPVRTHRLLYAEAHERRPDPRAAAAALPFRWCTFTRGGSWFIVPFDSLEVVDMSDSVVTRRTRGFVTVMVDGAAITLQEPVPARADSLTVPCCVTVNDTVFFAADRTGRRLYTRKDIVTPAIQPFRAVSASGMPGRVRLFGRRYIVIIPEESAPHPQS